MSLLLADFSRKPLETLRVSSLLLGKLEKSEEKSVFLGIKPLIATLRKPSSEKRNPAQKCPEKSSKRAFSLLFTEKF